MIHQIELTHVKMTNLVLNHPTNPSLNHLSSPRLTLNLQNSDSYHHHHNSSSFMLVQSPSPRMVIANSKWISPSPRMISASPKLISPRAELINTNHHGLPSKHSPKNSSPNQATNYGAHTDGSLLLGRNHQNGHDDDDAVSNQKLTNGIVRRGHANESTSVTRMDSLEDVSTSSITSSNTSPSRMSSNTSPTTGSPSTPKQASLTTKYPSGSFTVLDFDENDDPTDSPDYILPTDTCLARQALERLVGNNEILGSHHSVSPLEGSDESLRDIMYDMVSSRLLVHAYIPHQGECTNNGRNDWLYGLLPDDLKPSLNRHVGMVINGSKHVNLEFDKNEYTRVCKFDLGKMYAASVMQGYFLARVHKRFKLEKRLDREYSMSMEAYMKEHRDTLNPLRVMKCTLTVNVIERHVEQLFGKASIHTSNGRSPCPSLNSKDTMDIQLGSVENLILHALAFGALLCDVECHFIPQDCYDDVARHHS